MEVFLLDGLAAGVVAAALAVQGFEPEELDLLAWVGHRVLPADNMDG